MAARPKEDLSPSFPSKSAWHTRCLSNRWTFHNPVCGCRVLVNRTAPCRRISRQLKRAAVTHAVLMTSATKASVLLVQPPCSACHCFEESRSTEATSWSFAGCLAGTAWRKWNGYWQKIAIPCWSL